MKTALDWYCKEINYLTINYKIGNINENEYLRKQVEIYNQAKEMEKEQMVDFAFKYGDLTTREIADSFDKEYKTK